jgi:hypothetical protein
MTATATTPDSLPIKFIIHRTPSKQGQGEIGSFRERPKPDVSTTHQEDTTRRILLIQDEAVRPPSGTSQMITPTNRKRKA